MDAQSKSKALGRLRRIEGQVQGIQRMVEEDKYCVDILLQLTAVQGAVEQVQKLRAAGYEEAAIDRAKVAYLLAADKDVFLKEPWVVELLGNARKMAQDAEATEQWFQAQRVYSDLGSLEPTNLVWKERFKAVIAALKKRPRICSPKPCESTQDEL